MTAAPYRYLNRDGVWPGFTWDGLELDDAGVLRLTALPRFDGVVPPRVAALPGAPPPAGVAVDADGTIYFTDPARGVVHRVDACSKVVEPVPCLGGHGAAPTRFAEPGGLLFHRQRQALYVADAGNGRIQVFDPATFALGQILGGFERPVSLAADDDGAIYVVDTKTRRVDQVTLAGDVVAAFWTRVQASGTVHDPVAVACDGPHVFVLDRGTGTIAIFDRAGASIGTAPAPAGAAVFTAWRGTIYAADPGRRRLAVLRRSRGGDWVRAGDAAGYEGPVAAVAADGAGGLLLAPGAGLAPLRLTIDGSVGHEGWLVSGPIQVDGVPHFWNRLHADVSLPEGAHLQFFIHTGVASSPPPPVSDVVPAPWRPAGPDAADVFLTFDGATTEALWIAARFATDAHVTPALAQLRVDFDQDAYLPYLPAIFREAEPNGDDLLLRYLSLVESFFRELEGKIDGLPALVDPAGADASALGWLAGFLALPLPETWREGQQREAIAGAYARYARRGTVAGLREVLRVEAGVHATIDEPIQAAGWWALPAGGGSGALDEWSGGAESGLGLGTVLASAEPQGAVVGTTATLDRSQLIADDDFGAPLFEAVAHRFTVRIHPGDAQRGDTLDRVRAIVEREKPAHTDYELCVLEPGIRVGYRARLGVDTLLGGETAPRRLGAGGLVLGGSPPRRLGKDTHVGAGTHL